jgi:hypothetical protein
MKSDYDEQPKKRMKLNNDEPAKKLRVIQPVNISAINNSLWLVKIPEYIAEEWKNAEHNQVLGSFKIGIVPEPGNKEPQKQLIVNLDNSKSRVKTFILKEQSNPIKNEEELVAFNSIDENFTVEGKVNKSLVFRPADVDAYAETVRERNMKATARRETQLADINNVRNGSHQEISQIMDFLPTTQKKGNDNAIMSSDDLEDLKNKMFEAFDKKTSLPFNEILSYCKETLPKVREADLRSMLGTYARYNKHGINKKLWELKAEYRDYGVKTEEK